MIGKPDKQEAGSNQGFDPFAVLGMIIALLLMLRPSEEARKERRRKIIMACMAVLLVILGLGCGWYYWVAKNPPSIPT